MHESMMMIMMMKNIIENRRTPPLLALTRFYPWCKALQTWRHLVTSTILSPSVSTKHRCVFFHEWHWKVVLKKTNVMCSCASQGHIRDYLFGSHCTPNHPWKEGSICRVPSQGFWPFGSLGPSVIKHGPVIPLRLWRWLRAIQIKLTGRVLILAWLFELEWL
jgi:hypothetical protein